MKLFQDLTPTGQVGRLRRLAEKSLAAYALDNPHLTLLNNMDSTVFRLDAESVDTSQRQRYVLRLYSPAQETLAGIRSTLEWLTLLQASGLAVSIILPNKEGDFITPIGSDNVPQTYNLVILNWMEGQFRQKQQGIKEFQQIGRFMAKLHMVSENFQPSPDFVRPIKDWHWFSSLKTSPGQNRATEVYSKKELELFRESSIRIKEGLAKLGHNAKVFGMIHGDLHQRNYLFYQNEVRVIDFDDCGWGYYLYDLAITLEESQNRHRSTAEDWAMQRANFLAAYQEIRALPENYEYYLELFEVMRVVEVANWILTWPSLTLKTWGPNYLRYALTRLANFLD